MSSTTTSRVSIMRLLQLQCLLVLPAVVESGFLRGVSKPAPMAPMPAVLTTDSSFAQLREQLVKLEKATSDVVVQKQELSEEVTIVEDAKATPIATPNEEMDTTPENVEQPATPVLDEAAELAKFMSKHSLVDDDVQCVVDCQYLPEEHYRPGWKQCVKACLTKSKPLFNAMMSMMPGPDNEESAETDHHRMPPQLHGLKALTSEVKKKLQARRKQREAEL